MARPSDKKEDFPWWLVVVGLTVSYLGWQIVTDELYSQILSSLLKGVKVTVLVTLVSFALASALGLLLAVGAGSKWLLVRQGCRLYVEVVRGVPIIVLLLYVAFALAPAVVDLRNWVAEFVGLEPIRTRSFPLLWRAIIALVIAYSAFISEIFRAGFQAVDAGQLEAARSLGLNRWQMFRFVLFPQAFRAILPPLGNDFVSLVKDSSLVSVLGVLDITQLGKVVAAGNFRYFETYNVTALIYLTITIGLSLVLRHIERRLRQKQSGE